MEQGKQKIIIDCDPGIDDALVIAMALARPHLDVFGITTVAGNKEVSVTTSNALKVLQYFHRMEIPVYIGAQKPLARELYLSADGTHGGDGLGNVSLPPPVAIPEKEGAVDFMRGTLERHHGDVIILAIGPLTNIAQLIEVVGARSVKQLYLMNGAFRVKGNATEYAEYNAFIDPEAARSVYSSGVPIKVVGLDVTDRVGITRKEFESITSIATPQARFFAITHRWAMEREVREMYPIFWDAVAFLWMVDDALVTSKCGMVEVDTSGNTVGRTRFVEGVGNVEVGCAIDREKFFNHLNDFLRSGQI